MKFLIVDEHVNYLIKTMAPVERSNAKRIPRVIGRNVVEEDDELNFLCWLDDEDNKRDEQ